MRIKAKVPIRVAKESVKLTKSGGFPLIAPCEPTVLEVNLFELTGIQRGPKTIDPASIDIPPTLVTSPPYLVEVTKREPLLSIERLVRDELRKKVILPARRRWPIHRGYFEITLTTRVDNMDVCGKAKLGGNNVGQPNNPIIPKEEDATSSASCRTRSKAL
jgi:hypothetical protein